MSVDHALPFRGLSEEVSEPDCGAYGFACFAPIILMLIFATATRNPPLAMGFAIFVGTCIREGNVWFGFMRFFDVELSRGITGYADILVFLFLFQMVTGAGHRSGGFQALADLMSRCIKDSFVGQVTIWLFGFVIFFDDYTNTQVVGACMLEMAKKMRISKEKLAFTVDCTASPVASLLLVSTWIAYELGQISDALEMVDPPYIQYKATQLFLWSVPFRFYSWFMLFFVIGMAIGGRDWGPMYTAEKKAREVGWAEDSAVAQAVVTGCPPVTPKLGIPPNRWWNGLIVPVTILILILPLMAYSGAEQPVWWDGIGWDNSLEDLIGNANCWAVLPWVSSILLCLMSLLFFCQWIPTPEDDTSWVGKKVGKVPLLWPKEIIQAGCWQMGFLFEVVWILIFAKGISNTSKDLGLPAYVSCALSGSDPEIIPIVTFVLACFCSLGTGTSWGTMAIMFPISVPLSINLCRDAGYDDASDKTIHIISVTIASVLGGSVWGDHCSIVSDTTVLSAAACQCDVYNHFKTQMPYAVYCGCSALILGFIPTAYGMPPGLGIVFAIFLSPLISCGISFIPGLGGPIPVYNPRLDGTIGSGIKGNIASLKSYAGTVPEVTTSTGKDVKVSEQATA